MVVAASGLYSMIYGLWIKLASTAERCFKLSGFWSQVDSFYWILKIITGFWRLSVYGKQISGFILNPFSHYKIVVFLSIKGRHPLNVMEFRSKCNSSCAEFNFSLKCSKMPQWIEVAWRIRGVMRHISKICGSKPLDVIKCQKVAREKCISFYDIMQIARTQFSWQKYVVISKRLVGNLSSKLGKPKKNYVRIGRIGRKTGQLILNLEKKRRPLASLQNSIFLSSK